MSEQDLWKHIKQTLQKKSPILRSVLSAVSLKSSSFKGQKQFMLLVPSPFHQKILKNYLSDIQSQIKEKTSKTLLIRYSKKENSLLTTPPTSSSNLKSSRIPGRKNLNSSAFFNKWTFSSFVPGPSNNFAFSLAQNIANQPQKNKVNPLFIQGPSGLGKTHLLHAIGNVIEHKHPHLKVLYLPAERFFNDCITHIRKNEMPAFRQKYRNNIHVLLLDDVQIMGRGESTQEEFFHTFESLKQKSCQIVLTSDQEPKNIKGLKKRIKTRFEGGVIADIQSPDKDTKIAIIKNKTQKNRLKLSEEIISYIASIPSDSVREIEGQINKIKMCSELQNKALSLSLIQELFPKKLFQPPSPTNDKELFFSKDNREISLSDFSKSKKGAIKALQKEICSQFYIKLSDLKSRSRAKNLVKARNILIYIFREDLKLSLTEIGYCLGGRNHSTISHSLKSIENQQLNNKELSNNISNLRRFIHKKLVKN